MPMKTIERRRWIFCKKCGRATRHRRDCAVRPWDDRDYRGRFRAWLHDAMNPWECLEHARLRGPRGGSGITIIQGLDVPTIHMESIR